MSSRARHLALLLLLWPPIGPAAAQTGAAVARPGDTLDVTVTGQAALSGKYVVESDGAVAFPLIGRVQAQGRTADEFADAVRQLAVAFYKDPQVRAELVRPRSVFVFGDAAASGAYELTNNMTVLEALTRAGYSGTSEVMVVRPKDPHGPATPDEPGAEVIRVNLRELENEVQAGRLSRNVVLAEGDTIYVPRDDLNRIFVSGQVRKPGAYSLPEGTTVLQALALAGGATEHAVLGRARITRLVNGELKTIRVNLEDHLQPGDMLAVPESFSFPLFDPANLDPQHPPGKRIRLSRALSIGISASLKRLGVDTNVFNEASGTATDFTVVGGPQVEAAFEGRRVRLKATGSTDFVYFRTHKSERSIDRGATATADVILSRRLRFELGGSVARAHERLNAEIDARAPRFERTASAAVRVQPSRRIEVEIAGRDFDLEFDRGTTLAGIDLADTLTERIRSVTASFHLAVSPLTTLVLSGTAATHRFARFPRKDADATEFSVGALFKPRALVSGEARIGYLRYLGVQATAPDFENAVGGLNLFYSPTDRTRFGATFERTTGNSFQPRFLYAVIDRYGGSVRQGVFRRFDVLLESYRERFGYTAFFRDGVAVGQRPTAETTQRYTGEFGVRVVGATRVAVNVTHIERLSNTLAERDYGAWRMWATVSYGVFQVRGQ